MNAADIELTKTCEASPEQYDAFVGDKLVGHLRLRWGRFTVYCPDAGGDRILMRDFGDGLQGAFDFRERAVWLLKAKRAIARWHNRTEKEK